MGKKDATGEEKLNAQGLTKVKMYEKAGVSKEVAKERIKGTQYFSGIMRGTPGGVSGEGMKKFLQGQKKNIQRSKGNKK